MISISLIKKWKNMLLHKSVFHVNQTEGLCYSKNEIKGYYNNLTDKVKFTKSLDEEGIPFNIASYGEQKKKVYFPIAVFQYGLGAYDLYLQSADAAYLQKARAAADWALREQLASGAWDTFGILKYSNPYSSMAQGEGASLLVRLYKETGEQSYLAAAEKAISFMLQAVEDGGTTLYQGDAMILMEYPAKACVLNGWIFSAFGLYDLWLATGKNEYRKQWERALVAIKASLPKFDTGHWTYYDLGKKYASPFYHSLHIELLKALQKLSGDEAFEKYIQKWSRCKKHGFWRRYAFIRKALQKLTEKKKQEWVLTA